MTSQRLPLWLVKPHPKGRNLNKVNKVLSTFRLHTVCQSAECPNMGECFSKGTATFMIMGDTCTRNCRFCAVENGIPKPPEPGEPDRVAEAVKEFGLEHVVITSVTRDDLPDGGADCFAQTIERVRAKAPDATVEILVPDFGGSREAVAKAAVARPDVFNHNLETVPRLYDRVRPGADYHRSLMILKQVKELDKGIYTKTGLMVGLGETEDEILEVMTLLRRVRCDFLTLGQYLSPSSEHLPVARFMPPEEFEAIAEKGKKMGFKAIASGPFVRSSYQSEELLRRACA